jgi:aminopeptidase-like protein
LSRNEQDLAGVVGGLVVGSLGDGGPLTYKRSRRGDAVTDRVAMHVLRSSPTPARMIDFEPYGYDERQFCSPGFDLPIGRLTRSPNGAYPEYHTSADDLSLVRPEHLAESLQAWPGSSRCWTAIACRSTAWARESRAWASAGCTARWAAPSRANPNTRCSGS